MYGYILRIALVGVFFAYPVPIGLLFSTVACGLLYYSMKFVFLYMTARPVAYCFLIKIELSFTSEYAVIHFTADAVCFFFELLDLW